MPLPEQAGPSPFTAHGTVADTSRMAQLRTREITNVTYEAPGAEVLGLLRRRVSA